MFWNKKTPASKLAHKQESLRIIATAYNCKSTEAEDFYKSFQMKVLVTGLGSRSQAERAIVELNAQKHIQANKMRFNPADTPAGLMELWSQKVLDEFGPNIVANTSAKHYLDQASEAISKNNHEEAIQLLEKALLHTDKKSRHYLQNSIGEYYLALNIEQKAIDCFKAASYNVALFESTNMVIWNKIKANEDKALYIYFDKYNKALRVNDKPVNEHSEYIENKTKMNAQALLEASTKAMAAFGVLPAVKPKMSAKDYLVQADELAANNQHKEALTLISDTIGMLAKGELVGDKLLKPLLINALGENQLALDKPTDAAICFEAAINMVNEIAPDNEELLSKFIANRKRVDDYNTAKEELADAVAAAMVRNAGAFAPETKAVIEASEDIDVKSNQHISSLKNAVIQSVTSYSDGSTNGTIVRFDNGDSTFLQTAYLQSLVDIGINEDAADLTLLEGCEVQYEIVNVEAGDTFISSRDGSIVTGGNAGTYKADTSVVFNMTIDYTEAKAAAIAKTAGLFAKASAAFGIKPKPIDVDVVQEESQPNNSSDIVKAPSKFICIAPPMFPPKVLAKDENQKEQFEEEDEDII